MLKSNLFPLTVTSMIVLVFGGLILADTIPGRWEKVDSRPAGTTLLIALKSGGTAEYSFKRSDPTALTVHTLDGNELTLPKADIERVVEPKARSSRPALIGAAIGGGSGAVIGFAISRSFDETFLARGDLMAPTFGAVGALVGALIAPVVIATPDEVIYQSP
jgi:hypothetical protein